MNEKINWMLEQLHADEFSDVTANTVEEILEEANDFERFDPAVVDYVHELEIEWRG